MNLNDVEECMLFFDTLFDAIDWNDITFEEIVNHGFDKKTSFRNIK